MKETATPQEVLNRHLELSRSNPEQDFLECYREDSFLIMPSGVRRGLERIRCHHQLNQELPNARSPGSPALALGTFEMIVAIAPADSELRK